MSAWRLGTVVFLTGCFATHDPPATNESEGDCEEGERGCACASDETCEDGLSCVDDICESESDDDDDDDDDDDESTASTGGTTESLCPAGMPGCPCNNDACDGGSMCVNDICVASDPGTTGGTTGDGTTGTSTSGDTSSSTTTAETTESDSDDTATGPDPASVVFEEDFEAAAENTVPEGWDAFVGWNVNPPSNMPGGSEFALADGTKPYQGTRSLHVSAPGSNPAMLTRPLPDGTNRLYVRSYVWLTNKLGQNPDNNHETLIGVRGSPGQASVEVRFGEIKGVIGTNEVPSDDISPLMAEWGMGPVITAGEWHCIEVAFLADTDSHEVRAWSDGVEVHAVDDPSQWNNQALGEDFLTGKFSEVIIGWHTFSSYGNEVWFDDVVVATERIGC